MNNAAEFSQRPAVILPASGADALVEQLKKFHFFEENDIEVYVVEAGCVNPEHRAENVVIMVSAPTDMECGMGVGFIHGLRRGM